MLSLIVYIMNTIETLKKNKEKKSIAAKVFLALFLIPWIIDVCIFKIYPFLYGIVVSFFNVSYTKMNFVGFDNYALTFKQPLFWGALWATVKICLITIPVIVVGAILISFGIHRASKKFKSLTKIILYLPAVTSEIILAIVWKHMFNTSYGLSASICNKLGIEPIHWLTDAKITIPLVGVLVASMCIAQPVILLSSAIDNVSNSYFEAAELDGANRLQKLIYITLPAIKPTISFVLITTTIANLQVFYIPFLVTGGGPENKTVTVLYLIYKNAFEYGKYGLADAQGMILFFVIGALVLMQYKLTKAGRFE